MTSRDEVVLGDKQDEEFGPIDWTPLRIENQRLNIEEYENGKVTLDSKPLAVFVELTQNCNLKCPMCRFGEKYRPDWNMSEETFDRLAEQLFPSAAVVDLRGWGESTMLPNFDYFIRRTLAYRPQLRLVTNGQINRMHVWELLMRAHAVITVSCDAADPELFERLRGGGKIERLKNSVRSIVSARNKYGAPKDSVTLNVVTSQDNLDDLPCIVDMAAELDVPRVTLNPLVTNFDDSSHLRSNLDRTEAAYAATAARARERDVELQLGSAPDPALAIPELVRRPACIHPWSYAYVEYDGGMGFCDHLMGSPRYALGKIGEDSPLDVWNSEEWQQIRRAHLKNDIPDRFAPCRFSYAHRYIDFEHLIHPSRAEGIVSTKTRVDITQRRDPNVVPAVPWVPEMADGIDLRPNQRSDAIELTVKETQ